MKLKLYILVIYRTITISHLISLSPIQVNSSMCIFPKYSQFKLAYEAWDFCTFKEKSCKATGIRLKKLKAIIISSSDHNTS